MREHRVKISENSASAIQELTSALNAVIQAQTIMIKQLDRWSRFLRTSGTETIRGLQGTTTLSHAEKVATSRRSSAKISDAFE